MSMSEPVSNAEIEDVLSSIRRLVSVDHRGEAGLGVKVDPKEQASHEDDQDIENDDDLSPAEDIRMCPTLLCMVNQRPGQWQMTDRIRNQSLC